LHSEISRKYSATGTFVGNLTEENENLKQTMKRKDQEHKETFVMTEWDRARDRAEHFKLNMKLNRENERLIIEKCALASKVSSKEQTISSDSMQERPNKKGKNNSSHNHRRQEPQSPISDGEAYAREIQAQLLLEQHGF
jgi:hypothetical protein